ncbi:MAG: DNA primase noncatalytic subunit PriX [Candidatus Marsarchaeota archaeon]|nr:DNA primase noncatalytic subunit PriX [Candidatus Marsarchaeota archaeon]
MNVNTNINKLKAVSLRLHKKYMGKIQTVGKMKIGYDDLKIYYTPGVAYPCLEISRKHELSYDYTNRGNSVAIVTNGTRILGLGKIGPEAGMPVMEGKALLMKKFGALDAVPLAISARTENEIVDFVKMIAPSFGIVNIEDIEMPLSLKVVRRLRKEADIPIFYDDSDGTGIVARAALINAAKLVKKDIGKMKIVVNGTGAAGIGIAAPYFVTVRKFSEEKAFMLISGYIEKCKELEGNTKINDAYIRYQCRYAKGKKMRPLAFEKSKDLLKDVIDLDELA